VITRKRILLVGCGPVGVAFCRTLLTRVDPGAIELTVVSAGESGRGTAFATASPYHRLNTRASTTSLDTKDSYEFSAWRRSRKGVYREALDDGSEYPARRLFGYYAQEVFATAVADARRRGSSVSVVQGRVRELAAFDESAWEALLEDGPAIGPFDNVVLALGHSEHPKFAPRLIGARYVANPWREELSIPADASVAIVGTRLTGIDVALELSGRGHIGPITMASRSGALPSVKGPIEEVCLRFVPGFLEGHRWMASSGRLSLAEVATAVAAEFDLSKTPFAFLGAPLIVKETTLEGLRADIEAAERGSHVHWQSVLAAVVPMIPDLWRLLDEKGKAGLSSTYRTAWITRVASFPLVTAKLLRDVMEAGALKIRGGLSSVAESPEGFELEFGDTRGDGVLRPDFVINATGPGYDEAAVRAASVTNALLRDGLAKIAENGGLVVDSETFCVVGPSGRRALPIYVLGDFSRSAWGATNTIAGAARQGEKLANVIAAEIESQPHTEAYSPA